MVVAAGLFGSRDRKRVKVSARFSWPAICRYGLQPEKLGFPDRERRRGRKLAQEKTGDSMNAMNPDLKPFLAHGGKLILYQVGRSGDLGPQHGSLLQRLVEAIRSKAADQSVRLYMVPGMQHCGGGPGATFFGQIEEGPRSDPSRDIFTSLVEWVESGKAPGDIIASKYSGPGAKVPEMTRPICPYPQVPEYKGTGDPNRAESFVCAMGRPTAK